MKRCPACHNTYTDDTLQFCLQDGVPLESAADYSQTDSRETESETVIRSERTEPETVSFSPDFEPEFPTTPRFPEMESQPERNSKMLLTIFATVIVMLGVFGVIGISAYLFTSRGSIENASNRTQGDPTEKDADHPDKDKLLPTPDKSATPIVTPNTISTPTVPVEPTYTGDVKKEVTGRVLEWATLAESRDLGSYMEIYGDKVDYYRKRGASRGFIRSDKRKAFSKYKTIKIRLGDVSVTPSKDGNSAEAVFDKEWLFAEENSQLSGKVQSQLLFRLVEGDWKIVSERDLKVYYVNK